jgi:hypothetical protein
LIPKRITVPEHRTSGKKNEKQTKRHGRNDSQFAEEAKALQRVAV